MINIQEIKPTVKAAGESSLLVQFNYSEVIVNAIKTVPNAQYHKKLTAWEIPLSSLNKLLDTLTFFDDTQLTLLNGNTKELSDIEKPLTEEEISAFKFQPFKHQIEGVNFGLANKKWLLLDNPGCGKTNQIIWLAETLKRRGQIDHCLIIAGINSLKSNWKKEIAKFSNEQSIIIGEKTKKDGTVSKTPMTLVERANQLSNKIDEFFVIINVESLRDEKIVNKIISGPNKFGMIAIDEVHKVLASGHSSSQGNNILKLNAEYEVAATGTLLLNNPINCWGPLKWANIDNSTLTNFKSQFCEFGGFNNSQVVGYKNLELLKEELENNSLRRSKENLVDLPPKTITVELLEMNSEHQKFYDAIRNGVKEEADKIDLKASNLLALTTRLRQATACPGILTSNNIVSTKIERAVEIVREIVEDKNSKVLVLSNFKQPIYQLNSLLSDLSPLVCTGDQDDALISNSVDIFQNDNEHQVMLGTHSKMGTGLTLNRATYLVCIDIPWTYAAFDQSVCRIFRITNTKPISVYVLNCKDTIDEHVWNIVDTKKEISDFIIDNMENAFSKSLQQEMFSIIKGL